MREENKRKTSYIPSPKRDSSISKDPPSKLLSKEKKSKRKLNKGTSFFQQAINLKNSLFRRRSSQANKDKSIQN